MNRAARQPGTYETDDGYKLPWMRIGAYQDPPTPTNRDVVINLRNLYSQFTSGRFTEAVAGSGLSYIDLFRKPGTFHVKYFPLVYYNRLYQGNWTATNYTAASGSYIEYADNTTYGGTKRRQRHTASVSLSSRERIPVRT